MTGFAVGAVVVVGLIVVAKVLRRRRWMRRGGHCGGHHRGGGRGRFMRHMISRRLGLRAEQAETLDASMQEVQSAMKAARHDLRASRIELAEVLRADSLDEALLAPLLARHEATVHAARDTVVEAIRRLHAQLDPAQRATLADWVARGHHHGPVSA